MARPEDPQDSVVEEMDEPATEKAALLAAPELIAQSFGEYVRAWVLRVRSGDAGSLPVVGGLLLISILFQSLNSNFLTAGNLVNLLIQGAVYMLLAMAEVWVLLLGEIDLSAGYVAGLGGVVMAELIKQGTDWPWPAAIAVALLATAGIGALHGTLITRIGLPSFVVTLAGLLGWQGVMLLILGQGGVVPINSKIVNDLTSGQLTVLASWIVMGALVAAYGARAWLRDSRRRASGLVAPPLSLTFIKIGMIAVAAFVVVAICNQNRAVFGVNDGVPWVIPIVLGVFAAWTVLLTRTRYGRYVYAIGGNPEAARRAGINLAFIRTAAFALCAFTAGIGMLLFASYLGGMSNNVNGGSQVLYAVAAAVIGGTSLFGGRGKPLHGLLGGLVIGAIYNGMYLESLDVKYQFIVTGLVLLAAVTIDSLSRRGAASGSVVRV